MSRFTINDIRKMADSRSFTRGLDYFERGRVLEAYHDETTGCWFGDVKGSGNRIYQVMLEIGGGTLMGDCTCPVGIGCKHAVATAMQLLQRAQRAGADRAQQLPAVGRAPAQPDWQRWLAELPPTPRTEPEPLQPGSHYLIYMLEPGPRGLQLATRKAYLKKDGTWSQIRHFSPDIANLGWHRPSHLLDEDVAILQLLTRTSALGQLALSGEQGHRALQQLLASGRFYFEDSSLRPGPARSLQWQWRQGENQKRQLVAELEGLDDAEQWLPIPVTPPCYLDMDNAAIGEIETPLPAAQLEHLLRMPPVADGELEQMAVQLRSVLPREHLPLPVEPKLTTVRDFTPTITLVGCDLGQYRLPGLKLHFDYTGFALAAPYSLQFEGVEQSLERDGHHYRIERDTGAEYACCDRIHELGLYLVGEELGGQEEVWLPDAAGPDDVPGRWQALLDDTFPELQQQGWAIEVDDSYHFDVQSAAFAVSLADSGNRWFEFGLDLTLPDGSKLRTAELVEHWLERGAPDQLMLNVDGDWIEVDSKPLQSIRGLLQDLLNEKKLDKPVRLPAFQAAQFEDTPDLDQRRAPATRKLIDSLKDFSGLETIPAPKKLDATLRDYQQQGLDWLAFLQRYGFGGILADDMGLGKTLQTLALVQHLKESGKLEKPALVIAPTSLTGNWLHEAAQFTPQLAVTLIHGPKRDAAFRQVKNSDLVITTYPLLVRDRARYKKRKFSLLVLDEAQAIKNPATKVAECVRELHSETRLCLSGTPLENHLGELWALMDFALPGLLGGRRTFNQVYRNPIEKDGDDELQRELARKVRPFMLRRTKAEVVAELPPKTESVQHVELAPQQRALYESVRVSMEKRIRELVARQGMARSHIQFLDALLKLRQACIDPRLVKLDRAANIRESAKLDWLAQSLPQLLEEGRNILIFSQFTQVLKLVEEQLKSQKVGYSKLTGQTRKRQAAIDRFQSGEARVFLISLKAGGSGLNLTAADVVIHMDPWWNPAVENQATDRAHRIGQDKPVFVYKLVAADTVEERINQMQQQKQALADALFDATGSSGLPESKEELLGLLAE